jgi:YVTN family beta-propeller protein
VQSNVSDLTVIMAVSTTSPGCSAPTPRGVAIDPELEVAVVTNPGCTPGNISLIDLKPATVGTVTKTIAVGTNPQGVAVISRLGKAVVTNRSSNNASVVDLAGGMVATTVAVGTEPIGVAINQDTATAVVANSASSTISTFNVDTGSLGPTASVDARPVAVAIDPTRNQAAVACATQNTLDLVDLSQASLPVTGRISGAQLPTGVVFDPVSRVFLVLSSLGNKMLLVNPDTQQSQFANVGINPTALAYNFQSSTLVIANTASQTVSEMDFLDLRIRAILGSNVAPQCLNTIAVGTPPVQQQPTCGVEIHPRTNLAVFADGDNNRVLLMPLPR